MVRSLLPSLGCLPGDSEELPLLTKTFELMETGRREHHRTTQRNSGMDTLGVRRNPALVAATTGAPATERTEGTATLRPTTWGPRGPIWQRDSSPVAGVSLLHLTK